MVAVTEPSASSVLLSVVATDSVAVPLVATVTVRDPAATP